MNEVSAREAVGPDWDKSREKEVDAWITFGAGKVVSRRHYHGSRILKTRWVYTIKPDGRKKSRLCVRGDIEKRQLGKIGELPSHESWAPSREADRLYYAITAEMKWDTRSSDYPNAFLQSDEDKLNREILLDLPPEARKYLNMGVDDVFLLYRNAYGTIDAPRAWQKTLQQEYEKQGFVIHTTIPTLFLLFGEKGNLEGHSKVHMDDSEYAGGTERFHQKMQAIQKRFKVPDEKIELHDYMLCGRKVRQDPKTKEIRVDLEHYAEMIDKVKTHRGRHPDDPLEPAEVTEIQRVVGQGIWYQSNAAPHASFRCSMLATMKNQERYACITSANAFVDYVHAHKGFHLHFVQVAGGNLDRLRVVTQHDASKSCVAK
ncbi:MAG: reverse transcriptase domain-containing protein, partial [Dehalococcoidia bacterium]|nr:reverse transcriptase domain-containing protein [Dehalococcoidia bacterium]